MPEPWACLKCGAELEHDWMPCPNCGWKAPGPWDPDSEEPDETSDQARFRVFSKKTPWMRLLAIILFLILVWGLLWRFWRTP